MLPCTEIRFYGEEPDNKFDPWAILVKRKDGTIVGRVPTNLCRTFQMLKNNDIACNFRCKYTGNVQRSSTPHYLQRFERNKNFDKQGGGAVLSCIYYFDIEKEKREEMIKIIKDNIKADDLGRFA